MSGNPFVFQQGRPGYANDPRYAMAQRLLEQGTSTAPVSGGGWGGALQGLSRVLQAGAGAYQENKIKGEYEDKLKKRQAALAEAVQTGDMTKISQVLLSDPETADKGLDLTISDSRYKRDRTDKLTDTQSDRDWQTQMEDRRDQRARQLQAAGFGQQAAMQKANQEFEMQKLDRQQKLEAAKSGVIANPDGSYTPKPPQPYAGTGMEAQNANVLLQGDPASPQYAAAYNMMAAPKTQLDPQTNQIVTITPNMSAYRKPTYAGPDAPPPGTPPAPGAPPVPGPQGQAGPPGTPQAPGGPTISLQQLDSQKPMGGQDAGRMTMLQQGMQNMQAIKGMVFGKDGSINRSLLLQGNIPVIGGAIPGGEGAQLDALMKNAIEARLRLESGAAVPDTEVKRAYQRFMPNAYDNDETVRLKLKNLEDFMSQGVKLMDPQSTRPPIAPAAPTGAAPQVPPPQPPQMPVAPQGMAPPAANAPAVNAPVKVNGPDDYAKLPPGTQYLDPNGNMRTKQ